MIVQNTRLRLHMWLETDEGQVLGLGRVLLLREVQKLGSLNKAAKALGMSYRAAWGRIKTSEEMLGAALVEKKGTRKGFILSPLGEKLLDSFNQWYEAVEAFALEEARKSFPWDVQPFGDEKELAPSEVAGREDPVEKTEKIK
ncbi:MAG: winged helix-turn-helix domain-containing protein [Desulfovibrio sp.]|uniref:winged helix-turn-helix domain-containing protein n=1 Tax=Desulfovibrio sp. 7SRBS1 TaxID=3378064 RepID=UPI003B3E8556